MRPSTPRWSALAIAGTVAGLLGCGGGGNTTGLTGVGGAITGASSSATGTGGGGTGGGAVASSSTGVTTVATSSSSSSGTSTTSTSTSTGGGGGGGGGATTTSTSATTSTASASSSSGGGLGLGANCTADAQCMSQLCKPVVIDSSSVCVTPCTQQSDCGTGTDFFCEPITAGSANGYCIPHSPAHCLSCTMNSDCGSLSEVCFQAPGDNALACNIDCSIAGASACPTDYTCTPETVNGASRMLCRPNLVPDCLDALGGYCDRLMLPQPCIRTNTAGQCIGQRTCLAASDRFDTCEAAAPQCKTDCSEQDPAGCTEEFCASAVDTAADCGMCGAACPGYLEPNDNVSCENSSTCTFSCQGENYDVNDDPSDGCEIPDAPLGNHQESTAADEGSSSDCDNGTPQFTIDGLLVSDTQVHANPAVVGFDTISGSAPDWYKIQGVGHTFCENDLVVTLVMNGSKSPACYSFTAITDKNTYVCQTDSSGTCGFNDNGGGQFSDNTEIYFEVAKTCTSAALAESVSYTISGHF